MQDITRVNTKQLSVTETHLSRSSYPAVSSNLTSASIVLPQPLLFRIPAIFRGLSCLRKSDHVLWPGCSVLSFYLSSGSTWLSPLFRRVLTRERLNSAAFYSPSPTPHRNSSMQVPICSYKSSNTSENGLILPTHRLGHDDIHALHAAPTSKSTRYRITSVCGASAPYKRGV